jgi:hypothetical protein
MNSRLSIITLGILVAVFALCYKTFIYDRTPEAIYNRDKIALEKAIAIDSLEVYQDFLDKNPKSPFQRNFVYFRDRAALHAAKNLNTEKAYEEFIKNYPTSEWLPQATFFLNTLVVKSSSSNRKAVSQRLNERRMKDRFIASGDEAYDSQTDLTWARCNYGQTWDAQDHRCKGVMRYLPLDQISSRVDGISGGWRLPDKDELHSFLEAACPFGEDQESRKIFFDVKTADWYATSDQHGDSHIWAGQCFGPNGNLAGISKKRPAIARLVRVGKHSSFSNDKLTNSSDPKNGELVPNNYVRFSVSGDEIYDRQTEITWKRCLYGQEWDAQNNFCKGVIKHLPIGQAAIDFGNVSAGWRIPNQEELMSLMEVLCKKGKDDNLKIFDTPKMAEKHATSTMNGESHLIAVQCLGSTVDWVGVGKQFSTVLRLVHEGK